MPDYESEIKALEDELKKTDYNKRTQMHVGMVKAKIARLKEAQVKRSGGGKKTEGYSVRKSGDATVILIGFPSVGKSTLLNSLTGAGSRVGSYDFTTLDVIPGMLNFNHARIQVLDVPGIVYGAASGRGRGKEVLAVMRGADLAIIIIDVNHPEHLDALQREIREAGLRLNQKKPEIIIKRRSKGGIDVASTVKLTKITKETISNILKEFRSSNADVILRDDIDVDQFIDAVEANKVYIPALVILNKIDVVPEERLEQLVKELNPDICISADRKVNIEELKKKIFLKLDMIRVYCKEVGKEADLNVPLIMRRGATVNDMCNKLHKDFASKFKFARVWGGSAKFPGQKQMLKHILMDGDIVEINVR
ncbi:MAG TPA: GTP-binding protein [Candidatus Nanoarchaeia archaeon]|nr:GTP-binding protein [Candidatus Nanoarchaeia archaeon]